MSFIIGTANNDVLQSGVGADFIAAGTGNDTIVWQNAGSDTIDGGGGTDVLQFKTTATSHTITVGDRSGHVAIVDTPPGGGGGGASSSSFAQTSASSGGTPPPPPAPAILDVDNVETLSLTARPDSFIQVGDLSATDVRTVHLDTARLVTETQGVTYEIDVADIGIRTLSQAGDPTHLIIDNRVSVGDSTILSSIDISHLTSADTVNLVGASGGVFIGASILEHAAFTLNISGGDGDDLLGAGVRGQVHGNAGNDLLTWVENAGHPLIDGGVGEDRLEVDAAQDLGNFTLKTVGPGQLVLSSATNHNTAMISSVEHLDFLGRPGLIHGVIQDLTNSGVSSIEVFLPPEAIGSNGGDHVAESLELNGSAHEEQIFLEGFPGGGYVTITGLSAAVTVDYVDLLDVLTINGGDGGDRIDAGRVPSGQLQLSLNGQGGDDVLVGANGTGSTATATLTGGDGDDVIQGGTGISRIIGGNGFDLLSATGGATFVFDAADTGADKLLHFNYSGGVGVHQVIELDHYGYHSFSDLAGHVISGPGTLTTLITAPDGHTIVEIEGASPTNLTAADFLFG